MSDRTPRHAPANGTLAEARSATALFLTLTAVIAGAIALAAGLGDGDTGFALVAGVIAAISFVVAVFCFSADAEPVSAPEPAPTGLATAD
jgi:Na+/melibiose symporter-like transporter